MRLEDYTIEDKIKFFDLMYRVGKEEYEENGDDPHNHDLGYWLRHRMVELFDSTSKPTFFD